MLRLGMLDSAMGEPSAGGPASGALAPSRGGAGRFGAGGRGGDLGDGFGGGGFGGRTRLAVEQLCAASLDESRGLAVGLVERLLASGTSADVLYETHIPRTAALLGKLWEDDRISFAAVTLGMVRLTEALRHLGPAFMRARSPVRPARRALFALVPGEEHALGLVMAADHFQRAGWTVQVELRADRRDLERLVAVSRFDLVGLSAGTRRILPQLAETIAALRSAARSGTRFAVGGALTALEPGLAGRVGADFAACCAKEALLNAEPAG